MPLRLLTYNPFRKAILMRIANAKAALTIAILLAAAPILSACNTTAGAGKDIAVGGQVITDAAKKATPTVTP